MRFKVFGAALFAAGIFCASGAHAQTEIQWWHSMGGALGEKLNALATKFNASQKDYKVVPVFKGSYPESMTAAIAAFRAGNAPHLLQVFEVGTATMMAAKGAIVPVAKVMARRQGAVRSASPTCRRSRATTPTARATCCRSRSTARRSSSTSTRTPSRRRGSIPIRSPKTWKEMNAAALQLKVRGQDCVYTSGWPSWMHIENFSAWHNVPIGTKENGMAGMDTVFTINSPLHVRHLDDAGRHGQEGPLHLRRAHQPGRGEVRERRVRDADVLHRRAGEHPAERQVRLVGELHSLSRRREGRAAELDHRRRVGVGDGRQEARRLQGRREVPRLPVEARDPDGMAHRHRATCRSPWRPTK